LVREAFFKISPDLIAVELPDNIRDEIIEGIERLPYLSLIAYADSLTPNRLNFVPIDPGDSIIDAIRLGLEYGIETEFIDFSVKDYTPQPLFLPDDFSITEIGLKTFYNEILDNFNKGINKLKNKRRNLISLEKYLDNLGKTDDKYDSLDKDILREKYMASNLLKLMPLYHRILLIIGMAHWDQIKYYLDNPDKISDIQIDLTPFEYVKIYNIKSSDARFLFKELPYHVYKWILFTNKYNKKFVENLDNPEKLFEKIKSFNRIENIRKIILKAKSDYETEFKEFVDLHKLKILFQYLRNLTLTDKRLIPDLFSMLLAAKNVVDDDYAWKVYDWANKYPFDDKSNKYETMRLKENIGIDPNGKFIRLRRRHAYTYDKQRKFPLKEKPEEEYPGQWRDEWLDGQWNTVSYPPEDIIEEDYFAYIRKKAIKNLKNKRIKIEEFKSSLMDGIAIKETLRNWAFKKKIYVKNEQQIRGKIDAIVIIFDTDDKMNEKYPYKLTWWAEHEQESDMAFYSTNPGDYLIGPGISHVEIGGLLSIFPPRGIPSIWQYSFNYLYKDVKNKAERLLKAAILYSREKYIAYVADKPPRKYFLHLAGIKHREIIFIPIDHFSEDSLKTIKKIHILAGKDKRAIAHKYIFLD